jgi:hypothetical protein
MSLDVADADDLSDWDLWGPLVICLSLAIILSIDVSGCFHCFASRPDYSRRFVELCSSAQAPKDQSMQVFSLVISLITIVVTVNSKLLGGKV